MKVVLYAENIYKFYCPGCGNDHLVPLVKVDWSEGVWKFNGDLQNPTFTPSINISYPDQAYIDHPGLPKYRCHSIITAGNIRYCSDSTHELSGQEVPLPQIQQ